MIYEFLAVRFLQRSFGGSLDIWSSVIAVCLAALSLGYLLGGALADRRGSTRTLGAVLAAGGITGVFMDALAFAAGEFLLDSEVGVVWHPHAAALVSSFLPIFALGAVLPLAIRLGARRFDRVGSTAGWVAAVSTFGSIVGVLATTMLFLPRLGVRETLYTTSAVLVALGLVLMLWPHRRAAAALLLAMLGASCSAQAQTLFEDYSAYHHIIVEDVNGARQLRFDSAVQSTMSLADPQGGAFEYTEFFHVPLVLNPTLDTALFLGLGGGSGPKSFYRLYPSMQISVAEIDPVVVDVAKRFFALPADPRITVAIEDGRTYLRRSKQRYGIIVADAYASGPYGSYLPYHLATQEFFRIVWDRLEHGGCLVYNIIGVPGGTNADILRDIRTTTASVFQAVYTFQAASSLNSIVVAMKIDPEAVRAGQTVPEWPAGPQLSHPLKSTQLKALTEALIARQTVGLPGLVQRVTQFSALQAAPYEGRILTDNYAPVDLAPGRRR